jgi:hypothetical protein
MAGGSLTITVPNYQMLQQVAQRVTCWAGGVGGADTRKVQIVTVTPGPAAIRVPEEIFAAHGALTLEPGGADILSGYVAGTNITFNSNNGTSAFKNPNTCAADPAQSPTISTIAMNVGGNALQITLNYANFAGAGTVNITWGDGTATNGAAESGASNHTYPYAGVFTIRVTDATVSTDFVETTIFVPGV